SVIALMMMSRCITGNSLIITDSGIKYLKDLIPEDIKEKEFLECKDNLKISSKEGINDVSHYYYNGYSKTKKVILETGQELEGTYNHPLLTWNGLNFEYKTLYDIKINDVIVCQYNQQMFGNDQTIPEDLAYVLGILTGDGYIGGKRQKINWVCHKDDSEIGDYAASIIEKYFGDRVSRKDLNKSKDSIEKRNTHRYCVQDNALQKMRDLLYQLDMQHLGDNKRVPKEILNAPKETQLAFLSGCFDIDGSSTKTRPKIKCTSTSKRLLNEIQIMLLNLGILNQIRKIPKKKAYTIYLTGINAVKFQKNIKFRLKRKQEIGEQFKEEDTEGRRFYNLDILLRIVYSIGKHKSPE